MGALSGIFLIVRRSLRQHALSTTVTVLALALGCGLVMSIFAVHRQAEEAFSPDDIGFDAILGARGNKLQHVLNSVYHLESSPGNLPWDIYEDIQRKPIVDFAIPYALGDNYQNFRIVGTTPEIFTRYEYRKGKSFEFYEGGEPFDPALRSAVIGYTVARETGLRLKSTFKPNHGLVNTGMGDHDTQYSVCGVLKPTGTPNDRVIWIPIEGVWRMDGHQMKKTLQKDAMRRGEEDVESVDVAEVPDEFKEVSAVMLRFKRSEGYDTPNHNAVSMIEQRINQQGDVATMVYPIATEMKQIFDKMGWAVQILEVVAYLVVAVAAGSILASIYNTMNERRREFAILRALGARKSTVFSAIVMESGTIAALGSALGYGVYAAVVSGAKVIVQDYAGVVLDVTAPHEILWQAPLGMVALGVLSGILPAWKAYSTDVAANLVPTS